MSGFFVPRHQDGVSYAVAILCLSVSICHGSLTVLLFVFLSCCVVRFVSSQRMPHGMYEAYYPSQGGKSCNKFTVSGGNLQTRTNIVDVRRHK